MQRSNVKHINHTSTRYVIPPPLPTYEVKVLEIEVLPTFLSFTKLDIETKIIGLQCTWIRRL